MTTRSIPQPTPTPGSSRSAGGSPSTSLAQLPSGSYRPRKSRQASTSSSYFAAPDYAHRPSSLSHHRGSSQTGASGTSTPTGYPRKRRLGNLQNVPEGGTDWSGLDPDEVFRRLPVGEVKKVEGKMRSDAMNKQSELRSMVGTRYRDLLTSATQITALRESSLKLSSSLQKAAQACSTPQEVGVTAAPSENGDGEEVLNLLPIAAQMKLLLDAPEALYSLLSQNDFLKAAFLWLVARLAKESLAGMPQDASAPYLPLLQKQWETLTPFRSQIVQRATANLRSRQSIKPKDLGETLLSIILLDNLSVPDALSLFLDQRTRTIRDILNPPESSRNAQTRRDSRASTRSINKERDEIGAVLGESIKSLLETVTLVRGVFAAGQSKGRESLLEELERLIQVGEPLPSPVRDLHPRRTSHERRVSRLQSISAMAPTILPSPTGPPTSAAQVLQTLPSSQILLGHLPNNITAFTPFIAPSSASDIDGKLAKWQKAAIGLLQDAGPGWLAALDSVADIWRVRADLSLLLSEGELQSDIKQALEAEWGKRIEAVWETKLDEFVELAEDKTREAVEAVRTKHGETDINPEMFIFTEMPFPPAPTHALAASSAPFNTFLSTVKKRAALRTPLLDDVLTTLERFAGDMAKDMAGLPTGLYRSYGIKVESALRRLVETLGRVLADVSTAGTEAKAGVETEMLVGRVALYLASQSDCLIDLTAHANPQIDDARNELVHLHAKSVERWSQTSVDEAVVLLAPIFDPLLGPSEVASSWQGSHPVSPSAAIMVALHSLVAASRRLGLPPKSDLPIVQNLVEAFVDKARALSGWAAVEAESAAQAAFDLVFLGLLVTNQDKGESSDDPITRQLVDKIPSDMPSNFAADLPGLARDHLQRSQLLLHPLLGHLKPSVPLTASKVDLRNGLLRFGAPKTSSGVGTEFRSPLAVAKPGKRFGLLSVAA